MFCRWLFVLGCAGLLVDPARATEIALVLTEADWDYQAGSVRADVAEGVVYGPGVFATDR